MLLCADAQRAALTRSRSQYYGASVYGTGPPCLGNRRRVCIAALRFGSVPSCQSCSAAHPACAELLAPRRSPRESYDPEAENFSRERGSYQSEMEHP